MDKETRRVMEKTGLNKDEADIYRCFYENADFSGKSGIILHGSTRLDLGRLLSEDGISEAQRQNLSLDAYDRWLDVFRNKGLIAKNNKETHVFRDQHLNEGYSFPVLVGYNPFNDPELYVPYRKRGEERWSGRLPAERLLTEVEKMLAQGYEFGSAPFYAVITSKI